MFRSVSWKTWHVSPPDSLPKFFLDRSLGRLEVPRLLREHGFDVITLAEHYGVPADEKVSDAKYLELAGTNGWPVISKDGRIRSLRAEREAVIRFRVKYFYLSARGLPAQDMVDRLVHHRDRVGQAVVDDGPFVYIIHKNRMERLDLEA